MITSAAPLNARPAVLAAVLLLLPTVSPAAKRPPPPPASDAGISKTLEDSAIGNRRIPAGDAAEPYESQHFTLLSLKKSLERSGVLETAYTSFMSVTNVPENRLPPHLRVVIFRTKPDYTKVARANSKWHYSDGEISTYEQKNMNSELVKALASLLFDQTSKAEGRKELVWLRDGVVDAVEASAARVPPDERQAALRQEIKRVRPVGINEMATQKVVVAKDEFGLPMTGPNGKKKKKRPPNAGKRLRLTGICLTYYLMSQDRSLSFSYLLKGLSDGKHLDDALSSAYPGKVRGLRELYDRWIHDEVGAIRPIKDPLP